MGLKNFFRRVRASRPPGPEARFSVNARDVEGAIFGDNGTQTNNFSYQSTVTQHTHGRPRLQAPPPQALE